MFGGYLILGYQAHMFFFAYKVSSRAKGFAGSVESVISENAEIDEKEC